MQGKIGRPHNPTLEEIKAKLAMSMFNDEQKQPKQAKCNDLAVLEKAVKAKYYQFRK